MLCAGVMCFFFLRACLQDDFDIISNLIPIYHFTVRFCLCVCMCIREEKEREETGRAWRVCGRKKVICKSGGVKRREGKRVARPPEMTETDIEKVITAQGEKEC